MKRILYAIWALNVFLVYFFAAVITFLIRHPVTVRIDVWDAMLWR